MEHGFGFGVQGSEFWVSGIGLFGGLSRVPCCAGWIFLAAI